MSKGCEGRLTSVFSCPAPAATLGPCVTDVSASGGTVRRSVCVVRLFLSNFSDLRLTLLPPSRLFPANPSPCVCTSVLVRLRFERFISCRMCCVFLLLSIVGSLCSLGCSVVCARLLFVRALFTVSLMSVINVVFSHLSISASVWLVDKELR